MKLRGRSERDLLFVDKPYGIGTHAPDLGRLGMVEIQSRALGQDLHVVHRLDKTTSGAMVFAKTPAAAARVFEHFKKREVEKTYWLVTDRKSSSPQVFVSSRLPKGAWRSDDALLQHGNAEEPLSFANLKLEFLRDESAERAGTLFTRIKRNAFYELWQAEPITGKAHQIRLHARDAGLNILGDSQYGGTDFASLCLHSLRLKIPDFPEWICPAPRWFERLGWAHDRAIVEHLTAFDRRERLYHFLGSRTETLRLEHNESAALRADLLGEVLWMQWYGDQPPTGRDLLRCEILGELVSRPWILRLMRNRGKDPQAKQEWTSGTELPRTWVATEHGVKYEMRSEQGLSAGLFLDQREARAWLRANVRGLRVLNLFAYTCGFSLVAALGGAKEVTSVDVSREFLDWGRTNFTLNELDPSKSEFTVQDSILYLKGAIKRRRTFDFIVCDPPTFGRHKGGVFQLERDWKALLELVHEALSPKGRCLFSFNLESGTQAEWESRIRATKLWQLRPPPSRGWDFELPGEEPVLKSFLLEKKV